MQVQHSCFPWEADTYAEFLLFKKFLDKHIPFWSQVVYKSSFLLPAQAMQTNSNLNLLCPSLTFPGRNEFKGGLLPWAFLGVSTEASSSCGLSGNFLYPWADKIHANAIYL